MKKIAIAADHAGFEYKELIKKYLERWEGLQTASIEYYAETGKISGHLYKAIEKMLEEKAKEAYSQGVKDWEAANEKANKILDGLREKSKYNEAYNQGVRDAAESAEIELPNGLLCKIISSFDVNGEEFEFHIFINKQSILKLLK